MKKRTVKLILDALMAGVWIVLTTYSLTGALIHEWLGIAAVGLLAAHLLLNRKWIAAVSKKLFSTKFSLIIVAYICDVLLCISYLGTIITGLLMSRVILPNLNIGSQMTWKILHLWCAYIALIIMGIHIGLHWKLIWQHIRRLFKREKVSRAGRVICNILAILLILYGIKSSANYPLPKLGDKQNRPIRSDDSETTDATDAQNPIIVTRMSRGGSNDDFSSSAITETPETGETLDDFLGRLICTGCHNRCSLLSPRCGTGRSQAQSAEAIYQSAQTSQNSDSTADDSPNTDSDNSSSAEGLVPNENTPSDNSGDSAQDTTGEDNYFDQFERGSENTAPSDDTSQDNFDSPRGGNGEFFENGQHRNGQESTSGWDTAREIAEKISIMGMYVAGTYYVIELINYRKKQSYPQLPPSDTPTAGDGA